MYVSTDQQPYLVSIIKHPNVIGQFTHKWEKFLDEKGFPAVKPPWGSIVALNLNSGKIIWKVPFGEWESLKKLNIKKTGTFNRSGLTASSGNVIFASGTQDKKFYIINSVNGEELWSYKMSHPGSAPPLIFEEENEQYIIVPAFESGGKKIYAFKSGAENQ
jgi:quinoprotein glucose dehydrogenase